MLKTTASGKFTEPSSLGWSFHEVVIHDGAGLRDDLIVGGHPPSPSWLLTQALYVSLINSLVRQDGPWVESLLWFVIGAPLGWGACLFRPPREMLMLRGFFITLFVCFLSSVHWVAYFSCARCSFLVLSVGCSECLSLYGLQSFPLILGSFSFDFIENVFDAFRSLASIPSKVLHCLCPLLGCPKSSSSNSDILSFPWTQSVGETFHWTLFNLLFHFQDFGFLIICIPWVPLSDLAFAFLISYSCLCSAGTPYGVYSDLWFLSACNHSFEFFV